MRSCSIPCRGERSDRDLGHFALSGPARAHVGSHAWGGIRHENHSTLCWAVMGRAGLAGTFRGMEEHVCRPHELRPRAVQRANPPCGRKDGFRRRQEVVLFQRAGAPIAPTSGACNDAAFPVGRPGRRRRPPKPPAAATARTTRTWSWPSAWPGRMTRDPPHRSMPRARPACCWSGPRMTWSTPRPRSMR